MEWIVASGSLCLGLLIGILIAWYMLDVKEVNLTALYSSVAIAVGGSVLVFSDFFLLEGLLMRSGSIQSASFSALSELRSTTQ